MCYDILVKNFFYLFDFMATPPKHALLAVLKIALLSTSYTLSFMATSFSSVYPGNKQINSLVFAQENVNTNPNLTANLEENNTTQPTEQKTQEDSEANVDSGQKTQEDSEANVDSGFNIQDDLRQESSEIINFAVKQIKLLILILVLIMIYLPVFWLYPTMLLLLPNHLRIPKTPLNPEIKLFGGLLAFLKYNPRVLDAWINKHLATWQKKFLETPIVDEQKDYVSLPVQLNGTEIEELTWETLINSYHQEKRMRLLIWGEASSGKTTIACQIAKWAMKRPEKHQAVHKHLMLPVLINREIEDTEDETRPIIETILTEIQELVDKEETVDQFLIEQLLRKRRIFLIVDRYSEMSPETQEKINPDDKEFLANALVVVSRIEEKFLGIDAKIKTIRFDSEKLVHFLKEYLKKCGKWHLFEADQEEFLQECAQLAGTFKNQKTITPLLAKFYAEKMVNSKENNFTLESSFDNIPDLMLKHLQKLNAQGEIETRSEHPKVTEDAQLIAWKCVEQNYRPSYVEREKVVKAFEQLGRDDAALCLEYFEKQLQLLRSIGYGEIQDRNQIRFTLEPLAEYLAALYLLKENKNDYEKWQEFLATAEEKFGHEEIQGFLLAVRDCCLVKGSEVNVPYFVPKEIGKLTKCEHLRMGSATVNLQNQLVKIR